jgi:hypothetical protein
MCEVNTAEARIGLEDLTVQNTMTHRNVKLRVYGKLRSCPNSACKLSGRISSDPMGVPYFPSTGSVKVRFGKPLAWTSQRNVLEAFVKSNS